MKPAPKPLRVLPMQSEPTRFLVEAESLRCTNCGRQYPFKKHPRIMARDECPHCEARLEFHFYTVDLVEHDMNGQCDCPHFRTRLAVKLRDEPEGGPYRCKHLLAAREFCLDQMLIAHEEGRLAR